MIWYLNSKLYLNLSCDKDFRNQNSMVTWCINWRRLFPIIKRLAIILTYCNRLHVWWSTKLRLATLLSSLIARWRVGLWVVRYFMSILVLQASWWGRESWLLLLNLSSWCYVMIERLFLAVPRGWLRFVIVVFPDHTHLLFRLFDGSDLKTYLLMSCLAHRSLTCWIYFAPVFSFIYCWVLIFASSPCYILICVFWEMMHW